MPLHQKRKIIVTLLASSLIVISCWYLFLTWGAYRIKNLETQITKGFVGQMSASQKIGQLFHIGLKGTQISHLQEKRLQTICPGGIIVFKRNLDSKTQIKEFTTKLQNISQAHCRSQLLISIDQEGGRIQRIQTKSKLPSALSIGQTKNPEYARYAAIITGIEMADIGINLVLAPVLDVNNNPKNPVINTRSFGSDPQKVAAFGKAYSEGALAVHSGPVLKHFPGHGDTGTDSHLYLPTIQHDLKQLHETELVPFQASLKNSSIVMVAHILFPALDKKYPATLSKKIITGLLRKQLKFDGLVMTDALEMKAVADRYKQNKVARLALDAGADILLFADPSLQLIHNIHKKFLRSSHVSKETTYTQITKSVERQILYKLQNGFMKTHNSFTKQLNENITLYNELQGFAKPNKKELLPKRYSNDFNALSKDICRNSITSLHKDFKPVQKSQTLLLYKDDAFKKEANRLDLNKDSFQIGSIKKLKSYLKAHSNKKQDSPKTDVDAMHIIIEINARDLKHWNLFVENYKSSSQTNITALYSGNPFQHIQTKKNIHVLLNTTRGPVCKPALLYRALKNNTHPIIKKSTLVDSSTTI